MHVNRSLEGFFVSKSAKSSGNFSIWRTQKGGKFSNEKKRNAEDYQVWH